MQQSYIYTRDDGVEAARLTITKTDDECYAMFRVETSKCWDENNIVLERENVAHGTIKWDGCSHIYFDGQDALANPAQPDKDNYYHLCGVDNWKEFCAVLKWTYQTITKELLKTSADELWD